jgi:hypothetical protein
MANAIIRTIHAADTETVEVHWCRRWWDASQGWLEERLIERYTAPPRETWKARSAAQEQRQPQAPVDASTD